MYYILNSKGVFLATAVAISAGTIILFDLFKQNYLKSSQVPKNQDCPSPQKQLKSCLSSGNKKKDKEQKKRVQFADDVKDVSRGTNGCKIYRKKHKKSAEIHISCCGDEIIGLKKIPANHAVLYSGILKSRFRRIEYSY